MLSQRGIDSIEGLIVGSILIFGLIGLMVYLNRRRIRTHPSQKKERKFVERGKAKRDKKLAKRNVRF